MPIQHWLTLGDYNSASSVAARSPEGVAAERERLLSGSESDLLDYWSDDSPRGVSGDAARRAVMESIRPEDIYRRFELPRLQAGLRRDLAGIQRQSNRSRAAQQSLSKDLARGYGLGGARTASALNAGYADANRVATAQALAGRRMAFLDEATDPANMALLRAIEEANRKRQADQMLALQIGLGFLKSGADLGSEVGGHYLNYGLDRGLGGPQEG